MAMAAAAMDLDTQERLTAFEAAMIVRHREMYAEMQAQARCAAICSQKCTILYCTSLANFNSLIFIVRVTVFIFIPVCPSFYGL